MLPVKELFICERLLSGSLSFVQGTKLVKYIGKKESLKKEFKDVSVSHDAPRFVLRTNLFPCIEKVSIICERLLSGSLSFVQGTKLVKCIGKKGAIKENIKCVPA